MKTFSKYLVLYLCLLGALIGVAINFAQAQEVEVTDVEAVVEWDQAELDQLLAPIALYPDTLLSHILVASTYPLEVIQAARWREQNEHLDADQALTAVEDKDWDPSVKALAPFAELLDKLSDDLEWMQNLGDAFLANEQQVLSSVQTLRRKARDHGSLEDNNYIEVVEEDDDIIIQPIEREVVYVPYYDTRVVYGRWWWDDYPPIVWVHPRRSVWHAGFYWGPRVYLHSRFFFGGFHWHRRHLVVNHHYYYNPRPVYHEPRRVRVREYQRWQHDPVHRRGVRYQAKTTVYAHNKQRVATVTRQKGVVQRTQQTRYRQQKDRRYDQTYARLKASGDQHKVRTVASQNKSRQIKDNTYRRDKSKPVVQQQTRQRTEQKTYKQRTQQKTYRQQSQQKTYRQSDRYKPQQTQRMGQSRQKGQYRQVERSRSSGQRSTKGQSRQGKGKSRYSKDN